ncbi:MFS transporter [Saccharothrix sp. AJ9571]|nr:MFS transporter [Saccharothrix sp. AJ9571]
MTERLDARTYPLGLGTIAVGTSGYIMTGLLPSVTAELHVSPAAAGQLATVFALVCGLAAPATAAVTSRWGRRRLLAGTLALTAVGNAVAALAPAYPVLVAGRVITALGAAAFIPAATAVAAALNRPADRARASAVVFVGLALAVLIGVPLSGQLGERIGFRGAFWLVSGLCVAIAATIAVIVPSVAVPVPMPPRERRAAVADRRVAASLLATVLACMATSTLYTYLSPVLDELFHADANTVTVLLAVFGLGGVLGTLLGGRAADRYGGRRSVLVCTAVCAVALAALPLFDGAIGAAAVIAAVWGSAYWALNPPVARWLLDLAPPAHPGLLLPFGGSAIQLGNAAGGIFGGVLVAEAGVAVLAPAAAALAIAACGVAAAGRAPRQRAPHVGSHATSTPGRVQPPTSNDIR